MLYGVLRFFWLIRRYYMYNVTELKVDITAPVSSACLVEKHTTGKTNTRRSLRLCFITCWFKCSLYFWLPSGSFVYSFRHIINRSQVWILSMPQLHEAETPTAHNCYSLKEKDRRVSEAVRAVLLSCSVMLHCIIQFYKNVLESLVLQKSGSCIIKRLEYILTMALQTHKKLGD